MTDMRDKKLYNDTFDDTLSAVMQDMNTAIAPSDDLIADTRKRMAATKPRSKWIVPVQRAAAIAACTLLVFTGAVNASPAFAAAAAQVPIVRELVKAVAFDPSMKAAIEHNYVQLVKQSAEDNGYAIHVEYLVADPRNLTVYYKMDEITNRNFDQHDQYRFDFDLLDLDGNNLEGYGASWNYPLTEEERENLNEVKFHFTGEATLPEQVQLQLIVKKALPLFDDDQATVEADRELIGLENTIANFEEPEPDYEQVASMTVPLTIDQGSLFNVRTLELNQTVAIEGQKVIFDKVEIYPTQVRVLWHEDENNTHLLDGFKLELQNKKQNKWLNISNGVSGVGTVGTPRQTWLESSWFSDGQEYQIAITQYALIPKTQRIVTYDYATDTLTNMPYYGRLVQAMPCDTGLFMEFEFYSTTDTVHGNVLLHDDVHRNGSGHAYEKHDIPQEVLLAFGNPEQEQIYRFYNNFIIPNYEDEPIAFTLNWAPPKQLDEPIVVQLVDSHK